MLAEPRDRDNPGVKSKRIKDQVCSDETSLVLLWARTSIRVDQYIQL